MRTFTLAALLAITLAAGTPALAAGPAPAELLRWVPAGAEVVVAMDLAALREHPLVRSWLAEHQAAWSGTDAEAQDFLREAGLDPTRDVDSMVAAMIPATGSDRGLAAFGGRFDPATVGAALTKRGIATVPVGTASAFRLSDPAHPNANAPLLYLNSDVAVVGDEATLRALLAAPAATSPLVGGEVAAGRLDLRSAFWMVAVVPEAVREANTQGIEVHGDAAAEAVRAALTATRTVRRVTVQGTLADELSITGSAATDTEENAGLVRDAVKGAIAAARLQFQAESPELVEVLRDITLSTSGTEVRGSVSIPVALIEKLSAQHRQHHPEAERPGAAI